MNKKLQNAIDLVHECLTGYCEDNISSDKQAQKQLDKAWQVIISELINKKEG